MGGMFNTVIIPILIAGSLVDLFQFMWIVRRMLAKRRRALMEEAKRQLLFEQHLKKGKRE